MWGCCSYGWSALAISGTVRLHGWQPVKKNSKTHVVPLRLSREMVFPSSPLSVNGATCLPINELGSCGMGTGSSEATRLAPAGTSNAKASSGIASGNFASIKSTTTLSPVTVPDCSESNRAYESVGRLSRRNSLLSASIQSSSKPSGFLTCRRTHRRPSTVSVPALLGFSRASARIRSIVSSASRSGNCVGHPASPSASVVRSCSSTKSWSSDRGLTSASVSTCPGTFPTAAKSVVPSETTLAS